MSMKFKLDKRELTALVSLLNTNEDFKTVLGGLVRELDSATQATLFSPDKEIREGNRGVARALTMLMKTCEDAKADLQKFK